MALSVLYTNITYPPLPLFSSLMFKSGSGEEILNCRLTRNRRAARPNTMLSYSQSLQDSKDIMKRYGVVNISEKASGVTASKKKSRDQYTLVAVAVFISSQSF